METIWALQQKLIFMLFLNDALGGTVSQCKGRCNMLLDWLLWYCLSNSIDSLYLNFPNCIFRAYFWCVSKKKTANRQGSTVLTSQIIWTFHISAYHWHSSASSWRHHRHVSLERSQLIGLLRAVQGLAGGGAHGGQAFGWRPDHEAGPSGVGNQEVADRRLSSLFLIDGSDGCRPYGAPRQHRVQMAGLRMLLLLDFCLAGCILLHCGHGRVPGWMVVHGNCVDLWTFSGLWSCTDLYRPGYHPCWRAAVAGLTQMNQAVVSWRIVDCVMKRLHVSLLNQFEGLSQRPVVRGNMAHDTKLL